MTAAPLARAGAEVDGTPTGTELLPATGAAVGVSVQEQSSIEETMVPVTVVALPARAAERADRTTTGKNICKESVCR